MIASHHLAIGGGFAAPSSQAMSYMQNCYQQVAQMPLMLPQLQQFVEQSKARFIEFTEGATSKILDSINNKVDMLFNQNRFKIITDVSEMQMAPDVMVKYIMSTPMLRQLYLDGSVVGYGDRYISTSDGIAETHIDYRHCMNGMAQNNVEEGTWEVTNWYEPIAPVHNFSFMDRSALYLTMRSVEAMLTEGEEDPTSEWGENL